jgi:hypothetical protein
MSPTPAINVDYQDTFTAYSGQIRVIFIPAEASYNGFEVQVPSSLKDYYEILLDSKNDGTTPTNNIVTIPDFPIGIDVQSVGLVISV